jgi:hypothetical protein
MMRHFSDAEILTALWAWGGRVGDAARAIGMNRGQCYERLRELGLGSAERHELAVIGRVPLASGEIFEVLPETVRHVLPPEVVRSVRSREVVRSVRSGEVVRSVRSVRSVQEKEVVRVISGSALPTFDPIEDHVVSTADAAPITVQKRAWIAKPSRSATLRMDRALLELAEVGKDTDRDALLEAFILSDHFPAFVADIVGLYRRRVLGRDEEEGE